MNPMKLFWGLFLIAVGILLLGVNLSWWYFSMGALWILWPLILIVVGIRFMVSDDYIFIIVAFLLIFAASYIIVVRPAGFPLRKYRIFHILSLESNRMNGTPEIKV